MQYVHKKLIGCLLALEIADYEAKPIFDQVRLTQDFHDLLSDETVCASHDFTSIVWEEGALLVFPYDPEDCFRTALAIREATLTQDRYCDLQLRTGIDLGKAHITEDEFGHPHVSGEGRQDADRLMRQGPPRQISASRRFVELLSRSAPEMAELLEYQGPCSDNMGALYWYRAPAPQDTASEGSSGQPPTPGLASDVADTPTLSELAPVAESTPSMATLQGWLRRPRLGFALVVLVVGAVIVALSIRVSVKPPSFKPAAQVAVVTPQTPAPQAPESVPGPAQSAAGLAESLPAPVAPEQTIGSTTMTSSESVQDPRNPQSAASLLPEPIDEAAVPASRMEERAPDKVNSETAPKKKHKRSTRQSKKTPGEEPQLPAEGEATTDAMLTCARIEVLAKRLECFDKLKRGRTGNAGNG